MDLPDQGQPFARGNAHRKREVDGFLAVERTEHGEPRVDGDSLVTSFPVGGNLEDPARW